jgi:hypothetical protein
MVRLIGGRLYSQNQPEPFHARFARNALTCRSLAS